MVRVVAGEFWVAACLAALCSCASGGALPVDAGAVPSATASASQAASTDSIGGFWRIEGSMLGERYVFSGTMEVHRRGNRYEAILRFVTPGRVDGVLAGELTDGRLVVSGTYQAPPTCTGRMRISSPVEPTLRRGDIEMHDSCRGTSYGTIRFRR